MNAKKSYELWIVSITLMIMIEFGAILNYNSNDNNNSNNNNNNNNNNNVIYCLTVAPL